MATRTFVTKVGEPHKVAEDGTCLTCDARHEVRCRRKWRHHHIMNGDKPTGTIEVWAKTRYVTITDDGSVCNKYVTPVPTTPLGLPLRRNHGEGSHRNQHE